MSLKALTVVALVLVGCKSEPEPVELPPPTPCGDAIPTISEVIVFDNGPLDFGGEVWPSIRIELDATDPDGALTAYTLLAAYDDDIDGLLDMSAALQAPNQLGPHDCSVTEARLGMDIAINGEPAPGIFIELGVVLEDADGYRSEPPVVLTITTPEP